MGVALISLITFTVVAYKYKLRERDEVVNIHIILAEEYYSKYFSTHYSTARKKILDAYT